MDKALPNIGQEVFEIFFIRSKRHLRERPYQTQNVLETSLKLVLVERCCKDKICCVVVVNIVCFLERTRAIHNVQKTSLKCFKDISYCGVSE